MEITSKYTEEILKEMFRRVGANYDTFDFKQRDWYYKYTWTEKEQEDFRVWLGKYLYKKKLLKKGKYRNQDKGYYQAGKLIFNYGWKVEE